MSPHSQAHSAYTSAATPVRTNRGTEYAVFARITHRLRTLDESDKSTFPAVAEAVTANQRLWSTLAADLMDDGNALPTELRAQLISLAEFVRRHSLQVLSGTDTVEALVDINTSIMRGLRGGIEEVAA